MNESKVTMNEPNERIMIFEGSFILRRGEEEIEVKGIVYFDWFPNKGVRFSGDVSKEQYDSVGHYEYSLIINGLSCGYVFVDKINYNFGNIFRVKGYARSEFVSGDSSIVVDKIHFSIPNLREFFGSSIKHNKESVGGFLGRIELEDKKYKITIDKAYDYKERSSLLEEKGGYHVLYFGELQPKSNKTSLKECDEFFYCLNTFLTFVNGRRIACLLKKGYYENEELWCDYSNYNVDTYKWVYSWPSKFSIDGLNEIWINFLELWQDKDNKNFLESFVHWYVEANNNSGFVEGAIVSAQNALELLYNWWIVEVKRMIVGKDSENISASNKIRLILSQLAISSAVPDSFGKLKNFVNDNQLGDAPEAIVQIRNAIVHSQLEKRRKLDAISIRVRAEALQTCLWYLELSLLKLLNFRNKYSNRCYKNGYDFEAEELVPWMKL